MASKNGRTIDLEDVQAELARRGKAPPQRVELRFFQNNVDPALLAELQAEAAKLGYDGVHNYIKALLLMRHFARRGDSVAAAVAAQLWVPGVASSGAPAPSLPEEPPDTGADQAAGEWEELLGV